MILPDLEYEKSPFEFQQEGDSGRHDLDFDILGAKFSISVGEDPAFLEAVLAQFRFAIANTQGISGMKDPLNVAILTGFLLCDEINKLRIQYRDEQIKNGQSVNRTVQDLISRIEQVLEHEE